MQFFKSTLVLTLTMVPYVTAKALPRPQVTCGGYCGVIPGVQCGTGCICNNLLTGFVTSGKSPTPDMDYKGTYVAYKALAIVPGQNSTRQFS